MLTAKVNMYATRQEKSDELREPHARHVAKAMLIYGRVPHAELLAPQRATSSA